MEVFPFSQLQLRLMLSAAPVSSRKSARSTEINVEVLGISYLVAATSPHGLPIPSRVPQGNSNRNFQLKEAMVS